jgi:hypothetical protein
MSQMLSIVPTAIPCSLKDCPPGLFMTVTQPFEIGIKSEYGKLGETYDDAGEIWCGKGLVMPCQVQIEEGS